MARALTQPWGELRPGDHIAFIYEDTSELTAFVVPFIKDGLAQGERCVYVVGDDDPTEVAGALGAGGIDVDGEIQRGALVLMSAEEFLGPPPFDPLRAVERIRKRVMDANGRGFTGLRIVADMTWTLKEKIADDALVEYESLVDKAVGPGPLTAACMYRRDQLRPSGLQQVIRAHSKVVAGDRVHLSLSALFQTLARSDLQTLMQSARERRKGKGEFYFHQGDPATEVFVLTDGAVKLVRTDPTGHNVILAIETPPEPFGHVSALGRKPRIASAQALDDSRALEWDVPTILHVMMKHPAVSLNTIRLMVERIEEGIAFVQDTASPVQRRLARVLFRLAQSAGHRMPQGIAIELSLSGQDLAELAGSTPYTVSRILAEWRRSRIADARRERIVILNPQRIAEIAGLSVDLLKDGHNAPLP